MKIILDAMGGDYAPEAPVLGAIEAAQAYGAQITLVGRGEELLEVLSFYAGETSVYFVKAGKKMMCSQKVSINKGLMAELSTFLPENCIKIV